MQKNFAEMPKYIIMRNLITIMAAIGIAVVTSSCSETEKQNDKMSDSNIAIENIMTRTSVREYTSEPIGNDSVMILLKAAMAAPTAVNSQPWTFIVLRDMEKREKLAEALPNAGTKLTSSAVNIIVCGDTRKMLEREPEYWIQDCSAATENLLLAANALGLGAVWCGIYPNSERVETLRNIVNLDPNLIPLCIIPIGHPSKPREIKDKWKKENIIFME